MPEPTDEDEGAPAPEWRTDGSGHAAPVPQPDAGSWTSG